MGTVITDNILSANDGGEVSLLCFLDFSKCFDVTDHSTLLAYVHGIFVHGIVPPGFRIISKIMSKVSASLTLVGPLKSLLGIPTASGFFKDLRWAPCGVFANDLGLLAGDVVVIQYADDTQLLLSGSKSQLQNTVARLESTYSRLPWAMVLF